MNERHLEEAFAPVPAMVLDHIDEALTEVHVMDRKHRKPATALVFAIALMLALAGTAVATGIRWGMFDFLALGDNIGEALPEAREAIQTTVEQQGGELDDAVFTVREALYDNKTLWLMIDVVPTEADTLILSLNARPSLPASRLAPELPEDVALEQWAEENGYARMTLVDLECDSGWSPFERTSYWQEDGTVTIMLAGSYERENDGIVVLNCSAMQWRRDNGRWRSTELTVTIGPGNEPLWTVEWTGEAAFPGTEIVVESVTLTGTVVGMYVEICCTCPETEEWYEHPWLYPVDEQGKRQLWGAGSGISSTASGYQTVSSDKRLEENRWLLCSSYAALAEPPETLRLGGMLGHERLSAIEISLK